MQFGVSTLTNGANGHEAEERETFLLYMYLELDIEYLGHQISKEGLQPTEAKVRLSQRHLIYTSQN